MPIDKRFDQPSDIHSYSEGSSQLTQQPSYDKDPNWNNYVQGTQSSVFNNNELGSSGIPSTNYGGSDFNQSNIGSSGYTSTNIGSSNLGKTDSDFQSGSNWNSSMPSSNLGSSNLGSSNLGSSNLGSSNLGSSNLDSSHIVAPLDTPFDPSVPQGVDTNVDKRQQGFYTGVDAKTKILGEIKSGNLNKNLHHVDRESDSDLNRSKDDSSRDQSSNIGSSNLGKTDSDFQSGSNWNSSGSNFDSSNLGSSSIPSSNLGLQSSSIPSSNLGSNLDRPEMGSSTFGTSNFGSSNLGSSNFDSSNYGSSNLGSSNLGSSNLGSSNLGSSNMGSSNLGSSNLDSSNIVAPLDTPFDPSMPQGIDANVDKRAHGFYTGVDAKTKILGEIKGGNLSKNLNHIDRESDSDLNRSKDDDNSKDSRDKARSDDDSRDKARFDDASRDTNQSSNTSGYDSNAHPHREGAYMPETTQRDNDVDRDRDADRNEIHKEKKPFPERVADWVQNKLHPDKSASHDDVAHKSSEVDDINRGSTTQQGSSYDSSDVRSDKV